MELLTLWQLLLILRLCVVDLHVSDQGCAGKDPVVDPPFLLVEYGAPASAICHAQYNASLIGWEATVGAINEDDTQQLVWNVSNVTDWSLTAGATCYTNSDEFQCQTHLPITIYKRPDSIFVPPSGPLREGQQSWLQCEVQRVAPVRLLNVTWFRGATELKHSARPQFSIEGDPSQIVTVTTNLSFTASREDHGASYSCAAQLSLKTATDYKYTSNSIQLEVFYKPRLLNTSGNVTIYTGSKLKLTCLADAHPFPSYQWKHKGVVLPDENNNTLLIDPVTVHNEGVYECDISNHQGAVSAAMEVKIQRNRPAHIITGVLLVVVCLAVVFGIWWKCYRQ